MRPQGRTHSQIPNQYQQVNPNGFTYKLY